MSGAGDFGIERGIDAPEYLGHGGAPLGVERTAVEKVDLFQRKARLGKRLRVDAHALFHVAEAAECLVELLRRSPIEQREEALEVAPFGGEEQLPLLHLVEAEGGKGSGEAVEQALIEQSLQRGRDSGRGGHQSCNSRKGWPAAPCRCTPRISAAVAATSM